jgi:hypothetical protein
MGFGLTHSAPGPYGVVIPTVFRYHIFISERICVECLTLFIFQKMNSRAPYTSACAKRGAYSDPPPVVPDPKSIAAQAAYTLAEALLPRSAQARIVSRSR